MTVQYSAQGRISSQVTRTRPYLFSPITAGMPMCRLSSLLLRLPRTSHPPGLPRYDEVNLRSGSVLLLFIAQASSLKISTNTSITGFLDSSLWHNGNDLATLSATIQRVGLMLHSGQNGNRSAQRNLSIACPPKLSSNQADA
jgi:hypothetical protein